MASFTITRKIEMPADQVWAIASDWQKSPGPGISVKVEEEGDPESQGIGAIREITIGNVCVREKLESIKTPHSFTYRILSGAPMNDYLGYVEFIPKENSTIVQWKAELTPKIPLTGWICCKVAKGAINRFIDEIEKAKQ